MGQGRAVRLGAWAAPCALAALLPGQAAASPWNRDAGATLLITRTAYYEAEAEAEDRRFEQVTSEAYAEHGLTDRLMVGGKLAYAWQEVDQPLYRDALSGLAEAEAFLQWQAVRTEGTALGVAAIVAAPTETVSRLLDGVAFERDASAGLSAAYGRDLGPAFVSASVGPRLSLGDDADFLRADLTLGRPFGERGLLLLEGFGTASLGGAELGGVDYDLYQLAPSVVLPAGRFRVQLGATVDLAGEGVDLGAGGFFSLWIGR
jgi:hypothetical protein